jgi:hypothetical protein
MGKEICNCNGILFVQIGNDLESHDLCLGYYKKETYSVLLFWAIVWNTFCHNFS